MQQISLNVKQVKNKGRHLPLFNYIKLIKYKLQNGIKMNELLLNDFKNEFGKLTFEEKLIVADELKKAGVKDVKTGIFGADMKVDLLNDGPVTIIMDSEQLKTTDILVGSFFP